MDYKSAPRNWKQNLIIIVIAAIIIYVGGMVMYIQQVKDRESKIDKSAFDHEPIENVIEAKELIGTINGVSVYVYEIDGVEYIGNVQIGGSAGRFLTKK